MSLTAIDLGETLDYTSQFDTDKESPTIFKIGVLDSLIMSKISDSLTVYEVDMENPDKNPATRFNYSQRQIEVVRFGLKGWENFKDKQGKDVQFRTKSLNYAGKNYEVVSDQSLSCLAFMLIQELAEVIFKQNRLSVEERKNL